MSLVPNTNIENVRRMGGMTFDRYKLPIQPTEGYLVGVQSVLDGVRSLDIVWQELEYHYWPDENVNNYLGFWCDPETGFWYVDFVIHTYSKKFALQIAAERGELAIYDCKTGASIRV